MFKDLFGVKKSKLDENRRYKNLIDTTLITFVEDCEKEYLEVKDIEAIKHDFDYFCNKLTALDSNITKLKLLATGKVVLHESVGKSVSFTNHNVRSCILELADELSKTEKGELYTNAITFICVIGACVYEYLDSVEDKNKYKPDFESEEKYYQD